MAGAAPAAPGRRAVAGRSVAPVGLGGAAWSIGTPDDRAATATLHAALDAGVELVDTAVAYTTTTEAHHNERLVGAVLAERTDVRPVVVTKCGHHRESSDGWGVDGRPEVLARQCRGSLGALGLDALDVLLLHRPDPAVPVAESVGALDDLRREGLVRRIGVSNVDADQLAQARSAAAIDVVENRLSPLDGFADGALARSCAGDGTAYLAFSPLGGPGALCAGSPAAAALADLAAEAGCSVHQLALAHLLHAFPAVLAVVGASRPATIAASAAAASLALPAELHRRVAARLATLPPTPDAGAPA